MALTLNGHPQPIQPMVQSAMFYPNTYMNFTQAGEYTKHYYNGTERISSRLGEQQVPVSVENEQELEAYKQDVKQIIYNAIGQHLYDEPTDMQEGDVFHLEFLQPCGNNNAVYYYHPNHLSSTMYVTDMQQSVVQSFLYAPYGEIISEYNTHAMGEAFPKYSFNAKELDEETGMFYYEARYYAPPVFTSRDAMFEKYFWMSPYAYCANNPVKYVDPSGMEMEETWVKTGDGRYVYNSAVNNDADAVEIYGEGSKSLAYGKQYRTNKGNLCILEKGGFRVNGKLHEVKDEAPFKTKVSNTVKKILYYEGGHADPANTGRVTQQDIKVGCAVVGAISGAGVLVEGCSYAAGYFIVSTGVVNNVDNMFTNSDGKSGLQQLAGKNETAVNKIGTVKNFIGIANIGYNFFVPQKIIQSPFDLMSTSTDVVSTAISVTDSTKKQ